ncbi:MAG TPA: ABC transporter permease [Vicinamibacterales bacterium]
MTMRDLLLRVRALVSPRRVERELDEELAFHIERETHKHIANGLSPADARTRALARFGSVPLAADECRDARGVGLVEDLTRDVVYAFRAFRRAPLAAITIIATVALGLGLVTAVFTIYNTILFRIDAVRNPGELFTVEPRLPLSAERVPLTHGDYEAMRRETSVFTDAAALDAGTLTRIDGRPAVGALVSGNFFQMLGVQSALGRPLVPEDDARLAGRPVIVLSHAGWRNLFDADQGIIGRRVVINNAPFEIVGVMPDGFRGLGLATPAYWAPLASAGQFRDVFAGREETMAIEVVGRLKRDLSPKAAAASLSVWAARTRTAKTGSNTTDDRVSVTLTPRQGTEPGDALEALMAFAPLFFAFGLILLIGCANVANLLLARSLARQREIGVRLSLGASRRRIIRQLLTESLLLSLGAAVCGLFVSRMILEGLLAAAITLPPPDLVQAIAMLNLTVPAPDWRVALFVVAVASMSAVFFGLAPALHATRLDLVRTMRGDITSDARPGRARHALISLQVGASALLLICAVIFLRGAVTAASQPPAIRTSDTVRVSVANEPRRAALLQAVMADPSVALVSSSSLPTEAVIETNTSSRASVEQLAVSSAYFDVLGIDILRGRGFTPAERSADAGVVVVSETLARRLWPNGDSLGQQMRIEPRRPDSQGRESPPSRTMTVIGVARDPGRLSGMSYLETFRGVYLPASLETPGTWLMLRVRGNPDEVRQVLLDRLTRVDPALSNIVTLRTLAMLQSNVLRIGFWVSVTLGVLALILTVSGLFSVLSYVVEQQAKDIGVRMALGAAGKDVVQLVLSQSLRPVGVGLAAGAGLAAALAILLLTLPGASEIGDWVHVLDPAAYGVSVITIVTSCALAVSVPALRAARIDPIATLRKD